MSFLNHSKCSNASKWAVNTPYVIATHDFTPPDSPTFNIYYYLNSTLVCQFFHLLSGNCRISRGSSCGTCVNNYTLDGSIVGNVNITDLSLANSGTILTYDLDKPDISGLRLHTFTYSGNSNKLFSGFCKLCSLL